MAKLVRDRIPDLMRKQGAEPRVHAARGREYMQALKHKLVEEAREFAESEQIEELADILEAVAAILAEKKKSWTELEREAARKLAEKGGFSKKLILESPDKLSGAQN